MKLPYSPRTSFQTKLIIAMALMLLLIIAGAIISLLFVQSIQNALNDIIKVASQDLKPITKLQILILDTGKPIQHYLVYGHPEDREIFAKSSQQVELAFGSLMAFTPSLEQQELLYQARRQWQQVRASGEEILDSDPTTAQTTAPKMEQFHKHTDLLINLLERLQAIILKDAYQQQTKASDNAENTSRLIIIFSVSGAIIAVVATLLLIYSVLTPIRRLKQGAEHFGRGDLTHRVRVVSRDEFGELAKAFNTMAEQLEKDQAALEQMAIHDGLTGLYNHREFQRLLQAELERSQRYKHPLSLLMLDIDLFKRVNDSYGHQSGDIVLRTLADQMRNGIRKVDYAARYGGEEFVIILPEMTPSDALLVAERLRQSIAAQPITIEQGQVITITISIGVASFPDDADSKDKLIAAADKALYAAKAAGRNRVLRAV